MIISLLPRHLGESLLGFLVLRLARRPAGVPPHRATLSLMSLAWGNFGYTASLSYLRRIGRLVEDSEGTILECGSGLTTLLVGALARRRGRPVVVLEHDHQWYRRMAGLCQRLGLDNVAIHYAPLVDHGGFDWYRVPAQLPESFSLVICDGPPGKIRGGRYGLFPVLGGRLARDALIVLDDTHRKSERAVIHRWRRERGLVSVDRGLISTFTEIYLV